MAIEIGYASRNIGDVFYTLRKDQTLNGAVACDGRKLYQSEFEKYSDDSNIFQLIKNGDLPAVSSAVYDKEVKDTGNCAYFSYDESDGYLRVPTIKDVYIRATQADAQLYKYLQPAIPAHSHGTTLYCTHGKFGGGTQAEWSNGDTDRLGPVTVQTSTISSGVYKTDCKTVQPPSLCLRAMVQVVTSVGLVEAVDPGKEDPEKPDTPEEPEVPEQPTPIVRFQVPYVFVPGTDAKALEVNANFEYVLRALENVTGVSGFVDLKNNQTVGGIKTFKSQINAPSLELTPSTESTHGGYIDFHLKGQAVDYTTRLIEEVDGLKLVGTNYDYGSEDFYSRILTWGDLALAIEAMELNFEKTNKILQTIINIIKQDYAVSSIAEAASSSVAAGSVYSSWNKIALNTQPIYEGTDLTKTNNLLQTIINLLSAGIVYYKTAQRLSSLEARVAALESK